MSSTFVCGHCGASLEIPEDDRAVDVRCEFCSRHTRVPEDILKLRAHRTSPARSQPAPPAWLAAIAATVTLGGLGAAAWLLTNKQPESPGARPGPTPPIPHTAERTPAPAVSRHAVVSDGAEQASQTLQSLYASGCKTVVLPPTQSTGEQTVETKLVTNGTCVTVIAVSGDRDNELTLTMKTPLGVPLATPPRASELSFSVCPKMPGRYPTTIVPSGTTPYTVAAIECPAPKKASR